MQRRGRHKKRWIDGVRQSMTNHCRVDKNLDDDDDDDDQHFNNNCHRNGTFMRNRSIATYIITLPYKRNSFITESMCRHTKTCSQSLAIN
jgi:hypothetical protein